MPDPDRQRVYAAEHAEFLGTIYEDVVGWVEVTALYAEVASSPWWTFGDVELRQSRADSRSSSYTPGPGPGVVRIGPGMETVWTLVHELAHHVEHMRTGHGGHGPGWRADLVETASVVLGLGVAGRIQEQFESRGLCVNRRFAAIYTGEDGLWGEMRMRRVRAELERF